jgi:hypothetical protein
MQSLGTVPLKRRRHTERDKCLHWREPEPFLLFPILEISNPLSGFYPSGGIGFGDLKEKTGGGDSKERGFHIRSLMWPIWSLTNVFYSFPSSSSHYLVFSLYLVHGIFSHTSGVRYFFAHFLSITFL